MAPESVSFELPVFSTVPDPDITPEKIESVDPDKVKALVSALTRPAPDKLFIVAPVVTPVISRVPVTETPLDEFIDPEPIRLSVPTDTEVGPVNVLAPESVSFELPVFSTVPDPDMILANVPSTF